MSVEAGKRDRGVSGRLLAIGDIHGCDIALDALLERVAVRPADTLVVLGDVIDRGPGTRRVVDRLLELSSLCRLTVLKGNHEEVLFDSLESPVFRQDWLAFGGAETLRSYGPDAQQISAEHLDFLRSAVDYFETETAVFVHASLEPEHPLAAQLPDWLRWVKLTKKERPLASGKRVICGHTPQPNGLPWIGDGWVCIDTGAYRGLYLTCLDVTSDLVYQASQSGEFRGPVPLARCEVEWGSP
jgi:serine/threonine protein phosphatase 1